MHERGEHLEKRRTWRGGGGHGHMVYVDYIDGAEGGKGAAKTLFDLISRQKEGRKR